MTDLQSLPCRDDRGNVHVVVESPKGSPLKLRFEPKLGAFSFQRPLPLGVVYPNDWGFVPSTLAEDGDPLDAMVIFDAPTWPGVVIPARPIGAVKLTQRAGRSARRARNDRIIAVPADDPRYAEVADLPRRVREELERFFVTATAMMDKEVRVQGWSRAGAAEALIDRAARRCAAR